MITRRSAITLAAIALFSTGLTTHIFAEAFPADENGGGNAGIISAKPPQDSQTYSGHLPRNTLKPAHWVRLNPQPEPPAVNRRLKGDRLTLSR